MSDIECAPGSALLGQLDPFIFQAEDEDTAMVDDETERLAARAHKERTRHRHRTETRLVFTGIGLEPVHDVDESPHSSHEEMSECVDISLDTGFSDVMRNAIAVSFVLLPASTVEDLQTKIRLNSTEMELFNYLQSSGSNCPRAIKAIHSQSMRLNSATMHQSWVCSACNTRTMSEMKCRNDQCAGQVIVPLLGPEPPEGDHSALATTLKWAIDRILVPERPKHYPARKEIGDPYTALFLFTVAREVVSGQRVVPMLRTVTKRLGEFAPAKDFGRKLSFQPDKQLMNYIQSQVARNWPKKGDAPTSAIHQIRVTETLDSMKSADFYGYCPLQITKGVRFLYNGYCAACGHFMSKADVERFEAKRQELLMGYAIMRSETVGQNKVIGHDGKLIDDVHPYAAEEQTAMQQTIITCPKCASRLVQSVIWYEGFCNLLVWTHLAKMAGISLNFPDSDAFTMETLVEGIKLCRPWTQGADIHLNDTNFVQQCYLITHIFFVATDWMSFKMMPEDSTLFTHELAFILLNMDRVIAQKDVELVGEFVACCRLAGVNPRTCASMTRGVEYLEKWCHVEKFRRSSKPMAGDQVLHALFCVVIGMCEFQIPQRPLDEVWKKLA